MAGFVGIPSHNVIKAGSVPERVHVLRIEIERVLQIGFRLSKIATLGGLKHPVQEFIDRDVSCTHAKLDSLSLHQLRSWQLL